ncbi:MAG: transposase [Gammaproteobacteria bacterium]|nr:transposase [Gammaproteobacteria bacterium]
MSRSLAKLKRLAGSLERDHPGAANSLREGMDETLTVIRLGVKDALRRTLSTTNPVENLNGSVEHYTHNVKRWRHAKMIVRWVAAALVDAKKKFRRIRGYRDLADLFTSVDEHVGKVQDQVQAA